MNLILVFGQELRVQVPAMKVFVKQQIFVLNLGCQGVFTF